ncbi:hypothetical protein HRbin34_00218 [bacterium HR34]|nr:hypothetical protein HRbin34_00218 [bacterium HR34]
MSLSFRKKSQKNILLVFVFVVFIVSFLFYNNQIRVFFYTIFKPISPFFTFLGGFYHNNIEPFFTVKQVYQENKEIKQKITELEKLKFESELLLKKGKESLIFQGFNTLEARILSRSLSQDVLIMFTYSKDKPIKSSYPVFLKSGILIGFVDKVFTSPLSGNYFFSVKLLSQEGQTLEVSNYKGEKVGVLTGLGKGRVMLDLIPREVDLKEGYYLFSKSESVNVPEGFLVGQVKKVHKNDLDPFLKAEASLIEDPFLEEFFNVLIIP